MTEDVLPISMPEAARCTWCSAALPDARATVCPTCGATLVGEGDPQLPGVTALDSEAIARARSPIQRSRSRLLSWISGEFDDEDEKKTAANPGSLAPPPPDVQAEMLRLQIEADLADLEAEAGSIAAEAELEARAAGRVPAAEAAGVTNVADAPDTAAAPVAAAAAETADAESVETSEHPTTV